MTRHASAMDTPARPSALRHRAVVALVIAAVAVAVIYTLVNGVDVPGILSVLAFTTVGALIVDRRPGEPVGRICLGIGIVSPLGVSLRSVAIVIDRSPGPLPAYGGVIAVVANLLTSLAILVSGPLLISRFPHRAAVAWQRRLEDLLLVIITGVGVLSALQPGPLTFGWVEPIANPLAVDWLPATSEDALTVAF